MQCYRQRKPKYSFFPSTNLKWFGPGSNPSPHSEVSAAKHLNHGTAIDVHVNYIYYVFFWVIPRRLNFICRRFGTLCLFHLHRQVDEV